MPSTPLNSPTRNSCILSDSPYRSPQMRKEVLRTVYANAQALQNNVNTKTIENLEQMINEVDTINQEGSLEEKIKDQSVVLLDSEIMTISSNVLKKCTFSLSKNISNYDPNEFADKVKSYLGMMPDTILNDELDWSLLGKDIIRRFKLVPKFSMVLGTLRLMPKKEIVRRKAVREAQAPIKRPENVITLDKVEDSVEQTVVEITKIIGHYQKQHKKPLDFFSLVLHPTNFGRTIENILHVSFLIRDGIIKFTIDEDGVPHVQKSSKEEIADAKSNKKKRNIQNVLSLNIKQWKDLVKAYSIDNPMIDLRRENARNK